MIIISNWSCSVKLQLVVALLAACMGEPTTLTAFLTWGDCRDTCRWQLLGCNESALATVSRRLEDCMQVTKSLLPYYFINEETDVVSDTQTTQGGICEVRSDYTPMVVVRIGAIKTSCTQRPSVGWQALCICSSGSWTEKSGDGAGISSCDLDGDWEAAYGRPQYGIWLSLLCASWALLAVYTSIQYFRLSGIQLDQKESLTNYTASRVSLLWAVSTSSTILLFKLLLLSSWWDEGVTSFACAEAKHIVGSVLPLPSQFIDFVEGVTVAMLIGLLSEVAISVAHIVQIGRESVVSVGSQLAGPLVCLLVAAAGVACIYDASNSSAAAFRYLLVAFGVVLVSQVVFFLNLIRHQNTLELLVLAKREFIDFHLIALCLAASFVVGTILAFSPLLLSDRDAVAHLAVRSLLLDLSELVAATAGAAILAQGSQQFTPALGIWFFVENLFNSRHQAISDTHLPIETEDYISINGSDHSENLSEFSSRHLDDLVKYDPTDMFYFDHQLKSHETSTDRRSPLPFPDDIESANVVLRPKATSSSMVPSRSNSFCHSENSISVSDVIIRSESSTMGVFI